MTEPVTTPESPAYEPPTYEEPVAAPAPKPNPLAALKNAFAVDNTVIENGRWFTALELGKIARMDIPDVDVSFKIRSLGSRVSMNVRTKILERYGVKDESEIAEDVGEKVLVDHLAEAVVVDWRGPGMPAFTVDAARALFDAEDMMLLRGAIVAVSADMNKYRRAVVESAAKN